MNPTPLGTIEPYCTGIGLVAMRWSSLENAVHRLLWNFAGLEPNHGRCITQHVAFGTLWDSILALSEELGLSEDRRKCLKDLQNRCESLRLLRNEVVHALWGSTPDTKLGELTAIVVKARKRLKVEFTDRSVDEMHMLAAQIYEVALAIANEAIRPTGTATSG